ncbi:hypothetical protein FHS68_001027 [Dyadobacter arcticus]|uniref:Uncharacterized protein n=1 Tax=Dyadobacter arcticus TaxID=1078754 RepID=A0ABX0UFU3_9BACT|nr:hypothetical protein [Dyadobacter arcticus]
MSHPDRQAEDHDKGVKFAFHKVTPGDFEVVVQHGSKLGKYLGTEFQSRRFDIL